MPYRCPTTPGLRDLLDAQDLVITRSQALAAGLTRRAIDHRLARRQWSVMLPSVYLVHAGEPSRRQMLVAALRYAGETSAVDGADACRFHGMRSVAVDDQFVHVATPWGAPARSRGFVVIRRTKAPLRLMHTDLLRYVDAATAVIAATRAMRSERMALAALSEAVQRGIVSYEQLVDAHIQGSPRNARMGDRILEQIGAGARSAPEADFLKLAAASPILPRPLCNPLLRLPSGRLISPDAMFEESGVIHETNGRAAHAREDLFEDMQTRHDAMTAAGLIVLHNSPRRLRLRGREVISEVERCHLRHVGRGLPPGIELLRAAAA